MSDESVPQPHSRVLGDMGQADAQHRFLTCLANYTKVLERLFAEPLDAWESLSPTALKLCYPDGWGVVEASAVVAKTDTSGFAPELQRVVALNAEIVPLKDSLESWAREFHLVKDDEVATWAMWAAIDNLWWIARRPKAKRAMAWLSPSGFDPSYPAAADGGWASVSSGQAEESLTEIVIRIPARQFKEGERAFEKRFNDACKKRRTEYLQNLAKEKWTVKRKYETNLWLDRLARWQAGQSHKQIQPDLRNQADRTKLSRGIAEVADHIGITPRLSPHASDHRGTWK